MATDAPARRYAEEQFRRSLAPEADPKPRTPGQAVRPPAGFDPKGDYALTYALEVLAAQRVKR